MAHPSFLGLFRKQGVLFEQRKYQLAEGLVLKGSEGENRSELLLSVKITVREKYFKVRHVTVFLQRQAPCFERSEGGESKHKHHFSGNTALNLSKTA